MTDRKALSQQRFGTYAQHYVDSRTHANHAELTHLVALAEPKPGWHALDIATGGGHTALIFAPLVAQVTVTDYTPQMLDAARRHLTAQGVTNAHFQQADAEALPFSDAAFDLVTCRIAPHHFPDVPRFVREAARVLRPGGVLLVQDQYSPEDSAAADYINAFERLRDPSHNHALTRSAWLDAFVAAGLVVYQTETLLKRHDLLEWTATQGNPPETVVRLHALLVEAPPAARRWLLPAHLGTDAASFINRQIVIAARR
ncbi:MAG: class I SAM-dependent methyltransferase [Chloroflexota bacterium]